MLAAAKVKCKNCKPGECDEFEAIICEDLPCPDCRGVESKMVGCVRCGGRGYYVAAGCPQKYVDDESRRAIRLSQWADRGFLPRSGGLDVQRHRDLRLMQAAWAELAEATKPET